jgi:predicted CoA-binding protein
MPEINSPFILKRVLSEAKVVAVLGAHNDEKRPSFYVPDYLYAHGYRVIPVNPRLVGETLWGEPVRATLAELREPVDVVDVFRPEAKLPEHLDDMLAMDPLPKVVWLQLGIRHGGIGDALLEKGVDVVQDHCMLADHKRMKIGAEAGPRPGT